MNNGEDVDESYQSLSDLLSGMVFIFIITLIAYIINFSGSREISQTLGQQASDTALRKSYIIKQVSENLTKQNIIHKADPKSGIISISSDQLGFGTGTHILDQSSISVLTNISTTIGSVITCYSNLPVPTLNKQGCAADLRGQLNRIYIEGHTDNVPFKKRNSIRDNFDLSLLRAASIKSEMEKNKPFSELKRQSGLEEVLIPTGYGASDPIVDHRSPTSEPKNRRIGFRFELNQKWALANE